MTDSCEQFENSLLGSGEGEGDDPIVAGGDLSAWNEHLASCPRCREQAAANAALREVFVEPPPALAADFDTRMQERLERHVAEHTFDAGVARAGVVAGAPARAAGRLPWLRLSGLWVLAAYATAATVASLLLLLRLPWQTFVPPPALGLALGITLGTMAMLSPLLLLDRLGIVRPPG